MNRLHKISRLYVIFSISFYFISGEENPADCITRPMSSKQMLKSNFISGPNLLHNLPNEECGTQAVVIPNPLANQGISSS